ncbi:MAG TPA: ferritin-like protein, partial [Myxococcota bacterium]|nr:ferritin-like protein [Myxococcota bacterium]
MRFATTRRGRLRQLLVSRGPVHQPPALQIRTLPSLRRHLQTAIELEHATIPAYLCALYSLHDGSNVEVAAILRSVVLEEMLHLTLAANVLNAIGGRPKLDAPRFVPDYPTYLPHSDRSFLVGLGPLTPAQNDVFCQIEQPSAHDAPPEAHDYQTIGQFYAAIQDGLRTLAARRDIFTGDPERQVRPEHYYGGGGEVIPVDGPTREAKLEQALAALDEIIGQGEGVDGGIDDGDGAMFGQQVEVAHYFRFKQIAAGRYYQAGDTPAGGPTGQVLPVDWSAVY